ncbi:MAG TPA: hypothetical protein VKB29_02690, partial [Candidatus Binataceae bacterium]|nr:hypothetical protein [Candidatus Binataceae bacterium]
MRVAHSMLLLSNNVACPARLPARTSLRTAPRNKRAMPPFCAAIGVRIGGGSDADRDNWDGVCGVGIGGVFFGVWGVGQLRRPGC